MRFNIKKHFIQPEASYNVSKGEITFDKLGSQHPAIEPDYASVQSVLHSIDFPVLYGYNVVKKGPYGMSIFAGPKLRYLWGKQNEITFTNFDQKGIHEKLYPCLLYTSVSGSPCLSCFGNQRLFYMTHLITR